MEEVMVVGAGTMGAGIAQVMAMAGLRVIVRDVEERLVQKGLDGITANLQNQVAKGRLTAWEKEEIMGRITGTVSLAQGKDADLVVEAVTENFSLKLDLFRELDALCAGKTILASNTSSLSITALAAATARPGMVVGLHFFNPVPVMQLVEVIAAPSTSEETVSRVQDLARQLGKTPVLVKDSPGFLVNRMLIPLINEAAFLLMEGVSTAEDIDTAMRLGANHPIGPLALADMIGLDVCLAIMETLQAELGEDKYRPCQLLRRMVRAGYLGRKTGHGFYRYGPVGQQPATR